MINLIKELDLWIEKVSSFFKNFFHKHEFIEFDYSILNGDYYERKKCACGKTKTVIPPQAKKIKKNY